MKTEFKDTNYSVNITFNAEDVSDAAKLFRMVKSAKKETPLLSIHFSEDGVVRVHLTLRKLKPGKQSNFITLSERK